MKKRTKADFVSEHGKERGETLWKEHRKEYVKKHPVSAIVNETIAKNLAPAEAVINKATGRKRSFAKEFHDYGDTESLTGSIISEIANVNNISRVPGIAAGVPGVIATSAASAAAQTAARNYLYTNEDMPNESALGAAVLSGTIAGAIEKKFPGSTKVAKKIAEKTKEVVKKGKEAPEAAEKTSKKIAEAAEKVSKKLEVSVKELAGVKDAEEALKQINKAKNKTLVAGQESLEKLNKNVDVSSIKDDLVNFSEDILKRHREKYKEIYKKTENLSVDTGSFLKSMPKSVSKSLANRSENFGENLSMDELDTLRNFCNSAIESYKLDYHKQSEWIKAVKVIKDKIMEMAEKSGVTKEILEARENYAKNVVPIKENKVIQDLLDNAVSDVPTKIFSQNIPSTVTLAESMPEHLKEKLVLFMASDGGKKGVNITHLLKNINKMPTNLAEVMLPANVLPTYGEMKILEDAVEKLKLTNPISPGKLSGMLYGQIPYLKSVMGFFDGEDVLGAIKKDSKLADFLQDFGELKKVQESSLVTDEILSKAKNAEKKDRLTSVEDVFDAYIDKLSAMDANETKSKVAGNIMEGIKNKLAPGLSSDTLSYKESESN